MKPKWRTQLFVGIHDPGRNLAAVFNWKERLSTKVALKQKLDLEREEQYYQRLGKQYYDSMAISSCNNSSLKNNVCPWAIESTRGIEHCLNN